MTARTVGVSDSEPFQSAVIWGYRGSWKTLKNHTRAKQNAKWRNKNCMRNLTNVSKNNSVVNCEDTTVSHSSRPHSPSVGWRLNTKYRGYSGEQADLTGTNG
eukprot:3696048-Pleurochrysis_carterae.AAC.1